MRKLAIFVGLACTIGCTATSLTTAKTAPTPFEHKFNESVYIEVHNTPNHCLVRVWDLTASEDSPQAIFRGKAGQHRCRIYNMVNPEVNVSEPESEVGCDTEQSMMEKK